MVRGQSNMRREHTGSRMLDAVLGNKTGQLTGISMKLHFWDSVHKSIGFKIVLNRDNRGPWGKLVNGNKSDYTVFWQELGRVIGSIFCWASLHLTCGSHLKAS